MDVIANRIVSTFIKKDKIHGGKSLSQLQENIKSLPRVIKKKNLQLKADKLKARKKVLKETLKDVNTEKSKKLFKVITELPKKTVKKNASEKILVKSKIKNKKSQTAESSKTKRNEEINSEIPNKIKNKKNKDSQGIIKENIIKAKNKKIKAERHEKTENENVSRNLKEKKTKTVKKQEEAVVKGKNALEIKNLNISEEHIEKCVAAILKLAENDANSSQNLLGDENSPIFLQICCIKVPKTPKHKLRILLPHSFVSPDDSVALIVRDLQKGFRQDYEKTIDYFEELLQKNNCTNIKEIIPINKIKTEYSQFELKRNLSALHDYFLVDGRIAGHVTHLLGKHFIKKRKIPTPIKMDKRDLKHEIENSLRKSFLFIHSNGDSFTIQVGTTLMQKTDIIENIIAVCKNLTDNFPGGWANIRAIRIKTRTSLAIPIYITLKNKNKVSIPKLKSKRPKAYRTYTDELSTLSGNNVVSVHPTGKVTVKRIKKSVNKEKERKTEDK